MTLETILSIALGVGLAAACGFRVFVPLLVVASAAVFADLPPVVRWGAAVFLDGGAAGAVQAGTVAARLKSALFTGGAPQPR